MKWNEAQLSAITEKNKNILVSAAAGSGKTAVLTERICRLVKEDCDIDEMLIVTFTNAAAGEMRDRICKGLNEAMEEAGSAAKRLADQIDKISSANISTFHAFCYEVVRSYFFMTDVAADFGLCDEIQAEIFSEEAIEEVIAEFFERENPDFLRFLRRFSKPGNEKSIAAMIIRLFKHSQSLPEPEKWIEEAVAALENSDDELEQRTARDAKVLKDLTLRYGEIFLEKKLKVNRIGFEDAQHFALKILENPDVAEEYRERFKYIFVDEYQDTNALQDALVSRIARPDNLFMVGDVKQSIYSFRLAEPSLFVERYKAYSEASDKNLKIDLNSNFRSKAPVLDITNRVMEVLMTERSSGLAYDENASLKSALPVPEEKTSLDLSPVLDIVLKQDVKQNMKDRIEATMKLKPEGFDRDLFFAKLSVDEIADTELEAMVVCDRIKEIVGKTYYDSKAEEIRTISYKDIVVLMRSFKSAAQDYQDVFRRAGIPCYVGGGDGYFETAEISVFMNILRVVVNRLQDIPLLSVIHSPCFGFSSEEIARIRIFRPEGLFSEAFLAFSLTGKEALVEKCRLFLNAIERWREAAGYIPLRELLWKIADESGYFEYIKTLPMAKQRSVNLRKLFDLAETFRNQTAKGLEGFVNYIEKLSFDNAKVDSGTGISDDADCVQIMSIHKSKGLEYPVVFLAGIGRNFFRGKDTTDISIDKDIGFGIKLRSEDGSVVYKTPKQVKIDEKVKCEELAEEMRLLYVAMTRAREKLYLLGTASADKKGNYLDKIDDDVLKNNNMLEWVYPIMEKEGFSNRIKGIVPDVDKLAKKEEVKSEAEQALNAADYLPDLPDALSFVTDEEPLIYAHSNVVDIPVKFTATELARLAAEEKALGKSTDYSGYEKKAERGAEERTLIKSGFTAAEKGTITHGVLQRLDLKGYAGGLGVREQVTKMVKNGSLSEEEAEVVNVNAIELFLDGSLGERLLAADRVYREKEFLLLNKHDKEASSIIQGIIDCFFIENGEAVIIDYKTDYIPDENREAVLKEKAEYYKTQLMVYKSAVTEAMGIEVKETYLCFLRAGAEVRIS